MLLTVRAGWEYRTAPLSLPLQRAVSLFKARGREEVEGWVGEQPQPPPSLYVPSLFYTLSHLSCLCFLSLACIEHSSLSLLLPLNPSFFPLFCLYISLFCPPTPPLPPTERLLKGHDWLNLLCGSSLDTVTVVRLPTVDVCVVFHMLGHFMEAQEKKNADEMWVVRCKKTVNYGVGK